MPSILKSKLFWLAAVPLLLFGLYVLVGFKVAPGIVRSQAIDFVRKQYGRELTVGQVAINPLKLQADIRDLALPDTDGKAMIAFRRLFVDFEIASIWEQAFVFKDVTLDAPLLRAVIRKDGSVNLADLALPDEEEADDSLPAVWLQHFTLAAGTVEFADFARAVPLDRKLTPVQFKLEDFRTTPEGGAFGLSAKTQNAELLEWRGQFALAPRIVSSGDFAVTKLHLPGVLELADVPLPFLVPQGAMDLRGTYSVELGDSLKLDVHLPQMQVTGLSLRAHGVEQDYVTVPTVVVSDTRVAMPANTVALGTIAASGIKTEVWTMPDGTLNVDRLFASAPVEPVPSPLPEATDAAAPTAVEAPWTVKVGNVELIDAAVGYEDRALRPVARFELAPLNVMVSDVSLDLSQSLPVRFDTTINGKAKLTGQGKVVPEPFTAEFDIDLAQFPLADLQPYVNGTADLTIRRGTVGAKGKFGLAPAGSGQPELSFTGDATLAGFSSIDNALEQDFVNFERVELSRLRYALAPDSLSIDRVRVVQPFARVIVSSDAVLNVSAVLDPVGTAAAVAEAKAAQAAQAEAAKRKQSRAERRAEQQAEKAAAEARKRAASQPPPKLKETGMPIRVREVLVSDGTMDFADFSVQPNFAAAIAGLGGTISGLSTDPNAHAQVKLEGSVGPYSPVLISGEIQPFAFDRHTDIALSFQNISLPVFNPYSGKFAGYNIAKGKLFTDLNYQIDNRKLAAQHKIRIDQLEWGEATAAKSEATLPVKFATSLLKDADGVITLDIPVAGTLDDPTLRIGPIVWQVIKNILSKAVTAPFRALGALFKGAEEAQFIDFAPGLAALDPVAAENLNALGKSLAPKTDLRIEVPIGVDAALDGAALADARYRRELAAAMNATFRGRKKADDATPLPAFESLPEDKREEVLTALYTRLFGAEPREPEAPERAEDQSRNEAKAQAAQARLAWLEQECRARATAEAADLQQLGTQRGETIQAALLTDTGLAPERVFLAAEGKVAANDQRVRFELAVK